MMSRSFDGGYGAGAEGRRRKGRSRCARWALLAACLFAVCALVIHFVFGGPWSRTKSFPERSVPLAVEPLLQNPEFPSGCEAFSLAMCLRSMGYSVEPAELIDVYMPIDPTWTDFVDHYAGDARGSGSAMPPAVVACVDAYADAAGAPLHGVELTGSSFNEVATVVQSGYPVLTWITTDFGRPRFSTTGARGYRLYRNFHCVLLYRVESGVAYIADPLTGLVEHDARSFQNLWEECGRLAMAVSES